MTDATASTADEAAPTARRRKLAQDVRTARERLASASGLGSTYERELLRLLAQHHLGALVPQILLAAAVAGVACFVVEPTETALWLVFVLCVLALTASLAKRLLNDGEAVDIGAWRRRMVLASFLQGVSWALIVKFLLTVEMPAARIFVLFVLLMTAAVTAVTSAPLPAAVYAGVLPVAIAIIGTFAPSHDIDRTTMGVMGASGLAFFLFLAHRLRASALATIASRAEKDAFFADLEETKANSDEARRRAEAASLAKSRFLATMSHELRTPLNAILGFAEVMRGELFGAHANPLYKEYAEDIHASGQHLLNLIDEILDLSRIEEGRYELSEERVELADVLDDCTAMLALRARNRNLTIHEVVAPHLPALWVDRRAARQVVLNLLSNAVKFTPPGGHVTIRIDATPAGGQRLSILDDGPGIAEDEMAIVLSSFGRGTLAIKNAEQGSGLGLPIVKGLMDLHGGSFALRSHVGAGTEVTVIFPPERVLDALGPMPHGDSAAEVPARPASLRRHPSPKERVA